MERYDAIVLGVGGVGSAALFHLAQRGIRVLGIERFTPGHDRGSSHGQTRMIRQAYFEHPNYVPLVERAFEGWQQLEAASGESLYRQVGLLQVGRPESEVMRGVRASASEHNLPIENLSPGDSVRRFPGLRVPDDCEAIFESRAGYLLVEQCVLTNVRLAARLGAEVHDGETIHTWRAEGTGVVVETDRAHYAADRLVVTAGAWSGALLAELNIPLQVLRKSLFWFRTTSDVYRADRGCPAFLYDLEGGCFYGLPQVDDAGIKIAEHSGGQLVADPLSVNRDVDPQDEQRDATFVAEFLTDATTHRTDHTVCMYTMTPDGHFVVDRHPLHSQVVFAGGLSGHGFKFTGVLGEALAGLALDGETDLPIGFLSAQRESLRRV